MGKRVSQSSFTPSVPTDLIFFNNQATPLGVTIEIPEILWLEFACLSFRGC